MTTREIRFGSQKRPLQKVSDRPLWRDTYPVPVDDDTIYLASKETYALELVELADQPNVPDDMLDIVVSMQ